VVLFSSLGLFGPRRATDARERRPPVVRQSTRVAALLDARETSRRRVTPPPRSRRPERPLAERSRVANAGRQGQQVADHPPAPQRGLALLEGEHPVEGSWFAGSDRKHDPPVRESQSGLVARPRRFEV